MKKLFIIALASAALIGLGMPSFAAESSVAGGFEASGHIVTGAGWQRAKVNGGGVVARDVNGTLPGVIGAYSTAGRTAGNLTVGQGGKEDDFRFFVDEVELDLAKSLGENIRFRADLDFGGQTLNGGPRFINGSGANDGVGVLVEQAYATANIGVGNGVEFLVGRFNAPIGFEKVDVTGNDSISRSIVYRALRPNTFTGAKIYYAFSDMIDLNFYVANNSLNYDNGGNANFVTTSVPAAGFRLGFNWGEEGKKSTLGWSGVLGQDHGTATTSVKKHMTFLGDVDFNWWATDNFAVGGEGLYRQIDTITAGGKNGKYFGALVNLRYDFSDVWDGTLKYAFAKDVNGATAGATVLPLNGGGAQSLTGAKGVYQEAVLAGNYAIADGAKLKLEGSYSLINPTGANNNRHVYGVGGAFAYEF